MKREMTIKAVLGVVGLTASIASAQMKPILNVPANPPEEQIAPVVACFAEGTDPRYVTAVNNIVHLLNAQRLGNDYQLGTRWTGTTGSPKSLTWSLVPDGILLGSGAGEANTASSLFATFDSAFASQGGRATWVLRVSQIYGRWQALSGLTFTRVQSGANDWDDGAAFPGSAGAAGLRGDCRVGGHNIDGVSNILAYCYFPQTGDCVMDTSDAASNFAQAANSNRFLRNTVGHEFGHGIGLNHVCPVNQTKLMEPFLTTAFDGPRQDETRAAQAFYGDPYEDNNTAATAKPIGAVVAGTPVTFGTPPAPVSGTSDTNSALLSIDANGEFDYWSFTVNQPVSLTATVTPVGSTYLNGAQNGDGTCQAGTNFNALAVANLAIDVLASNGTTVLGTASGAASGLAETAANVTLPSAGTYYLRVYESDAPTQSQSYRLNVSAVNTNITCPSFTTNPQSQTVCQGTNVQFTAAASGSPAPTLQWQHNNVDIPGETGTTLTVFLVSPGLSSGTYRCVATNGCAAGPVNSTAATLTINTPVSIDTQPNPSQTVSAGSPVSFTVAASSTPAPTYQWRKNGVDIPLATNATYTINSTVVGDTGSYDCVVSNNPCDPLTSDLALLTVNGAAACYANCDDSSTAPILTANDFQCFLNAFAANQSYANCDGSTTIPVLTANDFQCFLNSYAAGCP